MKTELLQKALDQCQDLKWLANELGISYPTLLPHVQDLEEIITKPRSTKYFVLPENVPAIREKLKDRLRTPTRKQMMVKAQESE